MAEVRVEVKTQTYSPKFDAFDVHCTSYKVVDGQEIPVYTFVPRGVRPGKCPVIVHFHGGFLITGSAIYPDWTTNWSLSYAILHNAIIIAPEYRLLPESNGTDILSDIQDFWSWIGSSFSAYLTSITPDIDIQPDLNRVLCYGESAGGYLAVLSALELLEQELGAGISGSGVTIRALITAYAKVDYGDPTCAQPDPSRRPFGTPMLDPAIIEKHLQEMTPGKIVVAAFPPARVPIAIVLSQQGRLAQFQGADGRLLVLDRLRRLGGGRRLDGPCLFAFHARADSVVPCAETELLVGAWSEAFGPSRVFGSVVEVGDHGFDVETTLETPWLMEGLGGITAEWLGEGEGGVASS